MSARNVMRTAVSDNGHANGTAAAVAEAPKATRSTKAAASGGSSIIVTKPRIEVIEIPIAGTRALTVHAMDVKGIRQMANKWFQLPALAKEKKNPEAEFEASKYKSPDGWEGMHAGAFRAACIGAARMCDKSLSMTLLKRLIFIEPDGYSIPLEVPLADGGNLTFAPKPLVRIIGEATMRTDMITVDNGSPDIRFRAQYFPWSAVLRISYNANMISPAQIINLVSLAGAHEGVGDVRPSADSNCTADEGLWEVVEG